MSISEAFIMGLVVTVIAPFIAAALPELPVRWTSWRIPAPGLALLAAHAGVIAAMGRCPSTAPTGLALQAALLACAVVFWMPVLGSRRIGDAARCVYLFLASPVLDLPALYLIAGGHSDAGIAMVSGMLPLPMAAVCFFYAWMRQEERSDSSAVGQVEYCEAGYGTIVPFSLADSGYISAADQVPVDDGAEGS
jgi:hypothetical protein